MLQNSTGLYATKKTQKQKITSLFVIIILVAGKDEDMKFPPKEKRDLQ
jgi:hypothetical protein